MKLLAVVILALPFAAAAQPLAAQPPATKAPGRITGAAVYSMTQQYLAVAAKRPIGSPGHAHAEQFIRDHFKPEAAKGNFEADSFMATTPAGPLPMTNFIAKFPGKKDGIIVIASHYETNYPLRNINFFGANDGACTTALLIELGAYLRTHPPDGYSIWLLFDDGEEAVNQWSDSDKLYGTRHLAARWSQDGTLRLIKAFLVADMIGDKDLHIERESNSTPWLVNLLLQAAKNTGHSSAIARDTLSVDDDHMPFVQRNVPSLDIIDLDYGPQNSYHHTEQDTIDKISPQSLQVSADLFMEMIRLINQH